jgi:hypothetical protein
VMLSSSHSGVSETRHGTTKRSGTMRSSSMVS